MKNKGITLIALVITIIVLIILAGVSIGLLLGENGIITRARQAVEEYSNSAQKEQQDLNSLGEQMNSIIGGTNTVTAEQGTLLAMYLKAQEDNCTNDDGTCTNAEHLHIGDYVDYKNPTTGSYTATAERTGLTDDQIYTVSSTSNQLNWRVMGIDKETGGIKLLAGSPMVIDGQNVYLYLDGAYAYENGVDILNSVGALYKTEYATSARSVNVDDINELTGVTTEEIRNLDINYIITGKSYGDTYSIENEYTPESFLAGETTNTTGTIDGYGYTVNSKMDEEGAQFVTVSDKIYKMLFENTTFNWNGKFYCAASRGSVYYTSSIAFGLFMVCDVGNITGVAILQMFSSDNYSGMMPTTVRPVVILKPEVKNTEVPKIADKTEDVWNFEELLPG